MQAFVSSLTAALLFIHTVFGCCWHHAHDCTAAVAGPEACCCHDHDDGDSKQHEQPCQDGADCEGACAYVLSQKVKVEAPKWITIEYLAVLPTLADGQLEAATSWRVLSSLPNVGPPLRLHLLHQVLLN